MVQHIGAPAIPIVKVGDEVKENDMIAKAAEGLSVPNFAPITGRITYVDDKTIARFGSIPGTVRDLYAPSQELLTVKGEVTEMVHDKNNRIQLALPEECRFVELLCPEKNLCITRTSAPLSEE